MIYLPQPKPITINLDILKPGRKKVSWFNPVSGKYTRLKKRYANGEESFTPPSIDQRDWVLIIDVV